MIRILQIFPGYCRLCICANITNCIFIICHLVPSWLCLFALRSISELIERETEEYHKADPDPFDDRHPGKPSSTWALPLVWDCSCALLSDFEDMDMFLGYALCVLLSIGSGVQKWDALESCNVSIKYTDGYFYKRTFKFHICSTLRFNDL